MKKIIFLATLFVSLNSYAQQISGRVTDTNNQPIQGVNIYVKNTYDGGSSNAEGQFSFESTAEGKIQLIASMIGYQTFERIDSVKNLSKITIILKEAANSLDAIVLNAGSFKAGDNSKVSVMNPLDVVTTAGVAGDFISALQTLPGTQTVGEDGRLFVRGGSAEETQVFIDGLNVFKPYIPTTRNNPTRGRYSPFLFDGITFSTGGYSAEYGNSLSSVLLLNTIDYPKDSETNISIMSLGLGLGHTEKWDNDALSINTSYINLAPYNELVPDNRNWIKLPESFGGEAVYRHKFEGGLLKFYTAIDYTNFKVEQPDVNFSELRLFDLTNTNWYNNLSYHGFLTNKTKIFTGISYSHSKLNLGQNNFDVTDDENSINAKLKLQNNFSNFFKLNYGVEINTTNFKERGNFDSNAFKYDFNANLLSAFAEGDLHFSNRLAGKFGLRVDKHNLFDNTKIAPRLSMAYRFNKETQMSLAYGTFYQSAQNEIIKLNQEIGFQKAQHYILNFQLQKNKQLFRAEAFYKSYDDLILFDSNMIQPTNLSNGGDGYAGGLDLFWKDSKSIDNLQYWISYSYLDTQRIYENYPEKVMPNFATKHNASLVTKYWINEWRSQVGMTYNFASGRPFNNPESGSFMSGRTKTYNNLSLNWSYLISQQKILYLSAENVLGFNNVFGYEYSSQPNINGNFNRQPIIPSTKRSFFIGFFWTISANKSKNQLDNL